MKESEKWNYLIDKKRDEITEKTMMQQIIKYKNINKVFMKLRSYPCITFFVLYNFFVKQVYILKKKN